MDTFKELCDRIVVHTEIEDIIALLNLSTEDILGRFEDRIEENIDDIREFVDESAR
jgi:hypothetical protein